MTTLREEFDVWARTKYHLTDTVLDEFGGYNGDNVAGAWEGYQAATERAAKQVPMNWLDSMLTGPDRVPGIDKADAQTIEALLRRVAAAIRGDGGGA